MTPNSRIEAIKKVIENFLTVGEPVSTYGNELYYGYCVNGEYELKPVDVEELAKRIADLNPTP